MNLRSLQENVIEATQALNNVAEFIKDNTNNDLVFSTVRPINYGNILNRLDFSGNNTTFSQITVYKTQSEIPTTPEGGVVDLILGVIEAPTGWSFIPSGATDIWASVATWHDGINQSGWSTPFIVTGVTGSQGETGPQGPQGETGPQGPQGEPGKDAVAPQLKIEDGKWYISVDGGQTWECLGQATGDKGETGPQGPQGEQGPQGDKGESGKDGAPGQDGKNGVDGAPGQDGKNGVNGEDGRGIASIEKLFAVNNDPNNNPTEGWTTIENVSTSSTNRYMWCQEITEFTDGMFSDPIYYIIAVEGEPGANGTGGDAPIIYPAGVWSASKTYASTSEKCPYVFYAENEKYYMVKTNTSVPQGVVPTNTIYWDPIDSFEAIYSDIGLFNQALVGKWVFHGDYMFSQDGVDANGNPKKYSNFADPKEAIANGTFKPNVLFNSVTGAGNLKDVVVEKVNTHTIEDGVDKSITIENGEIISHNGDAVFGKVVVGNNNYGDQINVPLYKGNSSGSLETINAGGSVVIGSINAQNASGTHTITIQPGYVKFKTEIISPGATLCLKNKSTTIHEQQLTIQGTDSGGYYSAIVEGAVWDFDCTDVDKLDVVIVFKGQSGKTFTEISWNIISYIYQETKSTNTYLGKDGLTISGPSSIVKISESNAIMMYGSYGFKVSSEGIQKTSDAGVTWTSI